MANKSNVTNELATQDKQSTALTIAQLATNMPIIAGNIDSAVEIIKEGVTQGKKAWINTALAIRKVMQVDGRGEASRLTAELCEKLKYSRSMVLKYRQAGEKLLNEKSDIDKIPFQMSEYIKRQPKEPTSRDIANIKLIADWVIGEKRWNLYKGEIKENDKVKIVGFRIRAEEVRAPFISIHKQGSLIGNKVSIDYTANFANDPDTFVPIKIYNVDLGE